MKKLLLVSFLASLAMVGCKENDGDQNKDMAAMVIKIAGGTGQSKATDSPMQADENNILGYSVLVYDNGILEKVENFTTGLTQTINGLTTGIKKVVVLANLPSSYVLPSVGDAYTDLAAQKINLDDQVDWNVGLVMSGEATANLAASPASNQVTVEVARIVAKVALAGIAVNQPAEQSGTFIIESVYVTKARSLSNIAIPTTSPVVTSAPYYGGYSNIVVNIANERAYLAETIALDDYGRYFYIFANDNSDNQATIMGIRATYNGVVSYFPFKINDAVSGDGSYVKPNHYYSLNVTINNPGNGSPNPEQPSDPATLEVTVTPKDWVTIPTQNVSW